MYQKKINLYNNSYFQEINTSSYSRGTYIVKIFLGKKGIFEKKIIK
jgi:hypothetical protein